MQDIIDRDDDCVEMKIHGAVRASRLRAVDAVRPAVVTHEGWSSSSSSSEPIARRLSWAALEELSDVVARLLRDDLLVGLRGKPRVALLAGNSGEWLAAALGVSKTGAVLVPLNTRWSPPEVAEVLGDSGATVVLMDGPGQSLLAEALQSVQGALALMERTGLKEVGQLEEVQSKLDRLKADLGG